MSTKITSFAEFWPCYVRAHSRRETRILHGAGLVLALLAAVVGLVTSLWWILLAPVIGYGFAWSSHVFVEHNKPATFGHPFWSFAADCRMLFLMLAGRMDRHVRAAHAGVHTPDAGMMSAEDL